MLNSFIVKRNFANIFSRCFFLSRAGGLSILESRMSNVVSYHRVYRELLASLRFSLKEHFFVVNAFPSWMKGVFWRN